MSHSWRETLRVTIVKRRSPNSSSNHQREAEQACSGLEWDKDKDELSVKFPTEETELTKRGVLRKLAKVYDPLGLVSPVTLEGKLIFRDVCDEN